MKPAGLSLIGLTGGIACGKSAVVAMLEELRAHTLDADQVTRRLQEPGTAVYEQIVAAFGPEALQYPGGPLDRAKLGARVFDDPAELLRLEQIVHPAVREEISGWLHKIAAASQDSEKGQDMPRPVAVLDAIKLLESGLSAHCDAVWVVVCSEQQQVARLVSTRGMSESEARQRIAAQPPQSSRLPHADVVIDNSGTLEQTRQQVRAAFERLIPI